MGAKKGTDCGCCGKEKASCGGGGEGLPNKHKLEETETKGDAKSDSKGDSKGAMTDFPVPGNVKDVLSSLAVKDQVVLRSYIAGLRDQLKEFKVRAEHADDDDPHAHYHGHEKCTADHGHDDHDHAGEKDGHGHKEGREYEHEHKDDHDHKHGHGHKDDGHKHDGHEHQHKHKDDGHKHEHHDHDHEMKDAEDKKKGDDLPPWKKRAIESGGDASAAPFGGSWAAESSLDATK